MIFYKPGVIKIIRFIQTGDFHLDCPLGTIENTEERRSELLNQISALFGYVRNSSPDFLFLTGDIFDNDYVSERTIKFLKDHFEALKPVKIFISPGNHDYIGRNSAWTGEFPSNVHVFIKTETIEISDEVTVTGTAFTDRLQNDSLLEGLDTGKCRRGIDFLVSHGELTGNLYNPMTRDELSGFTFCALGHRHGYFKDGNISYAGAPYGRSFKEEGNHGFTEGTVDEYGNVEITRVLLKGRKYITEVLNLSDLEFPSDGALRVSDILRERLKEKASYDDFIRIKITGFTENTDLFTPRIITDLLPEYSSITVDTEEILSYDIESMNVEGTLSSRFISLMKEKINKAGMLSEENSEKTENESDMEYSEREIYESAIRYGLTALKGMRNI